ncbi:hypothetical protein [Streptomyces sp. NPDC057616]|uniref:hypothetical protein n=1 Tax=Streptomyces sp. NPDC057616 TaxID=3346183 RepID=UPI003684F285
MALQAVRPPRWSWTGWADGQRARTSPPGCGGVAVALARWNGAAIPAALIQGGIAFAGNLTLCRVVPAFLRNSPE